MEIIEAQAEQQAALESGTAGDHEGSEPGIEAPKDKYGVSS